MNTEPSTNQPSKRWKRWLIGIPLGLLLILVIGWFVVTSEVFLKNVVLPRVGTLLHAELTVESIDVSPFSRLKATGVRLSPDNGSELVRVNELEIHYRLSDLLAGNIALDSVRFIRPEVSLRQEEGGSNNLLAWLARFKSTSTNTSKTTDGGSGQIQFAVGKVELSEGRFEYMESGADSQEIRLAAENVNFDLDQFRNGQKSSATLGGTLIVDVTDKESTTHDLLSVAMHATAAVAFTGELIPSGIDADLTGQMERAIGRFKDSIGIGVSVNVSSSATAIRHAALTFSREGEPVGSIVADGNVSFDDGSGTLDLEIHRLPPIVLELVALKSGLDMDLVTFDSTNHIVLGARGESVEARGSGRIEGLSMRNGQDASPPVNARMDYDLKLNPNTMDGRLDALQLVIDSTDAGSASAAITDPFQFAWGGKFESATGSRLNLKLDGVDLSQWALLFGDLPLSGMLDLEAQLNSRDAGNRLDLKGVSQLRQATLAIGTNRVENADASLSFGGHMDELRTITIDEAKLDVVRAGFKPLSITATGDLDLWAQTASLATRANVPIANMRTLLPQIPPSFAASVFDYKGWVHYTNSAFGLDGVLVADQLDYSLWDDGLNVGSATIPIQATLDGHQLDWVLTDASLVDNAESALTFSSHGNMDLSNESGGVTLRFPDIGTELINSYLTNYSSGLLLGDGHIHADVHADLVNDGSQRWALALTSTNMLFVGEDGQPVSDPLGEHLEIQTVFHPANREFQLLKCEGDLYSTGGHAGRMRAAGFLKQPGNESSLQLTIDQFNENALRPLARILFDDRHLEKVDVEVTMDLRYRDDQKSKLTSELHVRNLQVSRGEGKIPFERQHLELQFDSDVEDYRIDLQSAILHLARTKNVTNVVNVSGWIDFSDLTALNGDVRAVSDRFDVTPLFDMLFESESEPVPEALTDREMEIAELKSAQEATELPFNDFSVSLDVRELLLRELVVTNWIATCELGKNDIRLDPFSLSLNGAPINLSGSFNSLPEKFQYAIAAELENVQLFPLVRTFYPEWRGMARGDIYGAVDLKGTVERDASLWSAANGHLYLGVTNAHAALLSTRWQNLLRPVGLILQTPELFSSPIDWFYSHTELGGQKLTLHQYSIMADAYIADVKADIPLNPKVFVDSALPNVPVHLFLSRNLLTQLNIVRNEDETSSYVELPDFLYLQGTFHEPKVEINKLKTSGMVLSKAGDYVGGTAGDLLKGAGGATEALGGILSGKKWADTNANIGPVRHGIDFVFRSVGSVFGGTGQVLEEGTGLVTGTDVVADKDLAARFHSFDWPRQFTNAPNAVASDASSR